MKIPRIAPCSFCGSTGHPPTIAERTNDFDSSLTMFHVEHHHTLACGARGPAAQTPREAILQWNLVMHRAQAGRRVGEAALEMLERERGEGVA